MRWKPPERREAKERQAGATWARPFISTCRQNKRRADLVARARLRFGEKGRRVSGLSASPRTPRPPARSSQRSPRRQRGRRRRARSRARVHRRPRMAGPGDRQARPGQRRPRLFLHLRARRGRGRKLLPRIARLGARNQHQPGRRRGRHARACRKPGRRLVARPLHVGAVDYTLRGRARKGRSAAACRPVDLT